MRGALAVRAGAGKRLHQRQHKRHARAVGRVDLDSHDGAVIVVCAARGGAHEIADLDGGDAAGGEEAPEVALATVVKLELLDALERVDRDGGLPRDGPEDAG